MLVRHSKKSDYGNKEVLGDSHPCAILKPKNPQTGEIGSWHFGLSAANELHCFNCWK